MERSADAEAPTVQSTDDAHADTNEMAEKEGGAQQGIQNAAQSGSVEDSALPMWCNHVVSHAFWQS